MILPCGIDILAYYNYLGFDELIEVCFSMCIYYYVLPIDEDGIIRIRNVESPELTA